MAVLDTGAYLDAVCEMIAEGKQNVPVPIRGVSMLPFLRSGDQAYLSPLQPKIRKGDILLFKRKNSQYVLHRVYKIRRDGTYLLLGDSQLQPEPVTREQFRAQVSFVRCGARDFRPGSFRWWFFAGPWLRLAPWRRQIGKISALFRKK